jgi:hypothetical protein
MFLQHIFATPILLGESDNVSIRENIIKLAYEFKATASNASLVSEQWNHRGKSSDQSDFDTYGVTSFTSPLSSGQCSLTGEPEWAPVCEFILDFARTMVSTVHDKPEDIFLLNMWTTIYPPGAYVPEHIHSNSLLSGVFYAKAEPNCGNLVFHDPSYIAKSMYLYKHNTFPTVDTKYTQQVKTGAMILFPSWLPHKTEVNNSGEDRIIISFNIGMKDDITRSN